MSNRWLVTGAGGQFGSVLLRELVDRDPSALGLISPSGPAPFVGETVRVDLTDRDALAEVVRGARPAVIIHAAALTNVSAAFEDPALATQMNVDTTVRLAELAGEVGARFVFVSTDLVFDGTRAPYGEGAAPSPLSIYGRTKAEAERLVLQFTGALIVRPPLMYGLPAAPRETTFVNQLSAIRDGNALRLFEDEFRTPIALIDAARSIIHAAQSDHVGVLHVAGPERLSRLEMGRLAAHALGRSDRNIIPTRQREMQFAEPRPADVSLDCGLFGRIFDRPPGRPMREAMVEIAEGFMDDCPG